MLQTWSYQHPTQIQSGAGSLSELARWATGSRLILITSTGFRHRGVVQQIEVMLGKRLCYVMDQVLENPSVQTLQQQAEQLHPLASDGLIALGGGSSLDSAKVLARLLGLPAESRLSELLSASPSATIFKNTLPVVAIPTSAGTGAEVTPFATVWDFENAQKYSLSGRDLYPQTAVLDPLLTLTLPESLTLSSGLDAVSHAFESIWNNQATPVSLAFSTQALQLALPALSQLKQNPQNLTARRDMLNASLLAGLAISQTRTALAHAMSYPLTLKWGLPHGLACSFTLPALLRFNLAEDDGRILQTARSLGYADGDHLAVALESWLESLKASQLLQHYLPDGINLSELSAEMIHPGRSDNNLKRAQKQDIEMLLAKALKQPSA
jgi:alcohol dehydrogenase